MDKILGLDLGRKTLGIALSSVIGTVHPHKLIRFNKDDYDCLLEPIKQIVIENNVKTIVIGLPLNLNGTQSKMSETCLNFKKKLEDYIPNILITMVDERLTSVEAHELLKEMNVPLKKHKEYVDMLAACQILQSYLNQKGAN